MAERYRIAADIDSVGIADKISSLKPICQTLFLPAGRLVKITSPTILQLLSRNVQASSVQTKYSPEPSFKADTSLYESRLNVLEISGPPPMR